MQINCVGGYFIFRQSRAGEISDFASLFEGLSFDSVNDYFTFTALRDAPKFAIAGDTYLGAPCTVTCEGEPWDVMRMNDLVFDFNQNKVVPLESITRLASITQAANYFLSPGLIIPGSVTDDGSRVRDYAAHYFFDSNKFKYSELTLG